MQVSDAVAPIAQVSLRPMSEPQSALLIHFHTNCRVTGQAHRPPHVILSSMAFVSPNLTAAKTPQTGHTDFVSKQSDQSTASSR